MKQNKKFAIGIPTLNRLDLLYPAMLYYEIDFPNTKKFIIDNGKQDLGWNLDKVSATIIENEENIGVAASWNRLCREIFVEHEYAIILNDDIYLGRQEWGIDSFFDWLKLQEDPADFFVGPKDWCAFIISKKCYEEVGDFDERFLAYYEDNDYAMRMKLLGKKVEILPFLDPSVFRVSETIKKDSGIGIKAEESKKKYIEKWGGLPGEEMKNALVLTEEDKETTIIAFSSSGKIITLDIQEKINNSLKNAGLGPKSYESFDINKLPEYRKSKRLIIVNENEIIDAQC